MLSCVPRIKREFLLSLYTFSTSFSLFIFRFHITLTVFSCPIASYSIAQNAKRKRAGSSVEQYVVTVSWNSYPCKPLRLSLMTRLIEVVGNRSSEIEAIEEIRIGERKQRES